MMSPGVAEPLTILGLDIGANSVGWVLIDRQEEEGPGRLKDAGVRVFEAGMNLPEESEKEASHNVERRQARQRRRLLERRRMRLYAVRRTLQDHGLLPPGDPRYDAAFKQWLSQTDPYTSRAQGLDARLEPHQIGRAIYHLAHRRGFLSNRRAPEKKDEKPKVLQKAIGHLEDEMKSAKARTLGEYLSRIAPPERRRSQYTLRKWLQEEFDKLWKSQQGHHPGLLTPELKQKIRDKIFHQRPLKSVARLVGTCELERGRKRAPRALLLAQRVRLLQEVNNAQVSIEGCPRRRLTHDERKKLVKALETSAELKFAKVKKILGFPQSVTFNLDRAGKKGFVGNKTAARLIEIFGKKGWDQLYSRDRDIVVEGLLTIQKEGDRGRDEIVKEWGKRRWSLAEEQAEALADVALEDGYAHHSVQAMEKLLPHLEAGLTHPEALERAYPDPTAATAVDRLPHAPKLRNPIVERALAETRKVVNSLIHRYGKPARIRIELTRDLKRTSREREKIWKGQRQREWERGRAEKAIANEIDRQQPSRDDIERYRLWEECNHQCPYTGRQINMADLFHESRFDVEHIIPLSRSMDNSFLNKTLCEAQCNRERKRNKTPWEAFGETPAWEDIIARVKRFKADEETKKAKRRRFEMKQVDDKFTAQQLNDTAYASRMARDYLARLYGNQWKKCVEVSRGRVTAYLRRAWGLETILGAKPDEAAAETRRGKARDDHRHHAIDAAVVALTTLGAVHALSNAAKQEIPGKARFRPILPPWEGLVQQVRDAVEKMIVSHRPERRVSGQLHKETFYGFVTDPRTGQKRAVVRKRVEALTRHEIKKKEIVDPTVRAAVEARLEVLRNQDPKNAFKNPSDHPTLRTRKGCEIPIHRVRVFQAVKPKTIGSGISERRVALANNHHLEVFEKPDGSWMGEVVTMLEAMRRKKTGEPIIRRQDNEGRRLLFSLSRGEAVQINTGTGERVTAVVQTISGPNPGKVDIEFRRHSDARKAEDVRKAGDRIRVSSYADLKQREARKVLLTPLGEIRWAND